MQYIFPILGFMLIIWNIMLQSSTSSLGNALESLKEDIKKKDKKLSDMIVDAADSKAEHKSRIVKLENKINKRNQ
jgi:hypothetical protein